MSKKNYNCSISIDANQTLYDAYKTANADNLSAPAIYDIENNMCLSHGELIQYADRVATGFLKMGITQSTCVGIISANSIYEPICFLALNKIGAVAKFLDFTKSIEDLKRSIEISSAKFLILDGDIFPIELFISALGLPTIVMSTTLHHAGQNYTLLTEMLTSTDAQNIERHFVKDKPSVIINSSGTTGTPKPIVHSDYALNLAAIKVLSTDFPLNRKNVMLKMIPSYIGLGLITTLYTCLLSGTPLILNKSASPEGSLQAFISCVFGFREWLRKNNLEQSTKLLLFVAPFMVRAAFSALEQTEDLSHIGVILAAGSKMGKDELDTMEAVFRSKGCAVPICNGYGQNEMCGAVSLNCNSRNKNGSAGFSVTGTEIKIVDNDTLMPVGIGQVGKILEKSESLFLYYDQAPEQTKNAFVTLEDGSEWFDTNDLGYIDEDGFLFITGRTSRVLIRFDCKISIDSVERKICSNSKIKDCAIIPIVEDYLNGTSVAFVTLTDETELIPSDEISRIIQEGPNPLSELELPTRFVRLESIPYMNNGKVDYMKLTEISKTI